MAVNQTQSQLSSALQTVSQQIPPAIPQQVCSSVEHAHLLTKKHCTLQQQHCVLTNNVYTASASTVH